MKDLELSLNMKVLLSLEDNLVDSSTIKSIDKDDQTKPSQNMAMPNTITKYVKGCFGMEKQIK